MIAIQSRDFRVEPIMNRTYYKFYLVCTDEAGALVDHQYLVQAFNGPYNQKKVQKLVNSVASHCHYMAARDGLDWSIGWYMLIQDETTGIDDECPF